MKRWITLLGGAVLAAATLVVTAPLVAGAAAGSTCDGFLAPGTYNRLVVPAGATCLSDGNVTVRGGITVGAGATFVLGSEDAPDNTSTITGGVRATNAANLQIHFATVSGGIDAQGGAGPFGGPFDITWTTIEDSRINGG